MKRKKYLCYNGKKEEFQLDKNKYGQPFMSIQNFLIYSDTAIMPKYVDGRVSSEGSLVKLKGNKYERPIDKKSENKFKICILGDLNQV